MALRTDDSKEDHKDAPEDVDLAKVETAHAGEVINLEQHQTHRGLKTRHSQMIALGGTIGTGLFVSSGQALRLGGPAFLLVSYMITSLLVFGIVTGSTEFSSYLPVPGSTTAYFGHRFFSRSMGFALGWMFWYICAITVPAEITAASLVIEYWEQPVPTGVWIAIILVVIVALNCFPVHVYGEVEFWFASIKVLGIIGMLFMALVVTTGGGPKKEAIGFAYWNSPGAVNHYIFDGPVGVLAAFVATWCFSVFAFVFSPELLIITGGEMQNPRQNLPRAGRRFIWRLVIFYVLSAFFLGMIIPFDDPQLLGGASDAGASPWSIGAKRAGIRGLDSVINAVILLSAWSAGNAWLYMASRSLYSMAVFGIAPAAFKRCTASGIPYFSIAFSASFSLLAFMNLSQSSATVFNWFVNLINSCGFISWICMCGIYLRFRKATFAQGIVDQLPYRSVFQPYASYVCVVLFSLMLLLSGFTNFLDGHWSTANFITTYIGIIIFLAFYMGHKVVRDWKSPWVIPAEDVDLRTGLQEVIEAEAPVSCKRHKWYDVWSLLFR
ncbi:proline-specific permease [Colletotrichum karsti]|uniref:Proline-specific permease n=1 Tax=Colletotrichum karsti TaxID=1095194 RepID=A0A9P6LM68_9PEZI|nr:proline-specific permease [Colletotrichum karsti]KAF9878518.1 proline-specific permease [Colletotrichum karsti]